MPLKIEDLAFSERSVGRGSNVLLPMEASLLATTQYPNHLYIRVCVGALATHSLIMNDFEYYAPVHHCSVGRFPYASVGRVE